MDILFETSGQLTPEPRLHYVQHEFKVPEGIKRLKLTLSYFQESCWLYLSAFSPVGYRGTRMKPASVGEVTLVLELSETDASPGGLPGTIEKGLWRAQLDVERVSKNVSYQLKVEGGNEAASHEAHAEATLAEEEAGRYTSLRTAPGHGHAGAVYYRGELHAHSHHSDGLNPVSEVVAAARHYGLNFLSLTDHFTSAGWGELERLAGPDLAVLKSLEVTGHAGHANLQGLTRWVDPFVDPGNPSGRTINDVADETRAQGGLFCVNHPFSLMLGWRYYDLDWGKCDLLEVYHHLTGSNNSAQLGLWDRLLSQGYRITGVGATDSHLPHYGQHRLGQVVTAIYAEALEPEALLAGLRRGRVYISLGPQLDFSAASGGQLAQMGETLPCGALVRLHVDLRGLEFPSRLVVLKNGLHFFCQDLPAHGNEPLHLTLEDARSSPGYYRLELYTRDRESSFETGREWDKLLLLSNPIYVGT